MSSTEAVFITGYTTSADFPIKVAGWHWHSEPFQMTYGGSTDAFVAEIDATGSALVYSSYLGGSGADFGQGIAVDSSGNAYVTGSTQSTDFPVVANALQPNINGSQNAFVTKVNFTGEALVYSTYLGGSAADVAQSIQVGQLRKCLHRGLHILAETFLLARTLSKHALAGGADAFVAELNATGLGPDFLDLPGRLGR